MRDRADSTVIGVLIIVGVAVALAAGLYVWVGKGGTANEAPKIVGLGMPEHAGDGATVFTLPAPGTPADWNDLTLAVDGVEGGYRIEVTGTDFQASVDDAPWVGAAELAATHAVQARDRVTVTLDAPATGARLVVLDEGGNRVVTSAPLRV